MKIAVYSTKSYDKQYLQSCNTNKHSLIFLEEALSLDTVSLAKEMQVISIFVNDDGSELVLKALKEIGIKHIAIRGAGYDQVDLLCAQKLGITVSHVPKYSPYAIAEHVVTLMMALNRKIVRANKKVEGYNFNLDDLIGFDLNEKKVGIIGCGKIGAIVAKIVHGFGCSILVYDTVRNEEVIKQYQAEYCNLDYLLENSDVITLHTPLNEDTRHLIDKTAIDKMKKGVMLINTCRGAVVDTQAVIDGLDNGKIAYFGMDVYEYEKSLFFKDHSKDAHSDTLFARLLNFENVLITGHQAFLTDNALSNIAQTTMDSFDAWSVNKFSATEL
ncbi:MAG: 2-hydroxyacid dehydrogenase [Cytophagaceae bacterium]|nr:2-hydroxyacid dehydrogenase [Cytophagaceae bacterium]